MARIIFYRQKCIGCNACVEVNKNRWRISRKDGKSNLIGSNEKNGIYILNGEDDELKSDVIAAKICPAKIIKIEKTR